MSESKSEIMSESMSGLERLRMDEILKFMQGEQEINSATAAKLLDVHLKTASRLLAKAEKANILVSDGKTKNKVYRLAQR